ncbi:hypothetical protein Trydic_g15958 [Trypoxylus dichotomus]
MEHWLLFSRLLNSVYFFPIMTFNTQDEYEIEQKYDQTIQEAEIYINGQYGMRKTKRQTSTESKQQAESWRKTVKNEGNIYHSQKLVSVLNENASS